MPGKPNIVYDCAGLRIACPFPLVGPELTDGIPDLTVRLGEPQPIPWERPSPMVIAERLVNKVPAYTVAKVGDEYVIRLCGFADFVVSDDFAQVFCIPDPSADVEYLSIIVGGTVAGFIHAMRGSFVLHASAVDINGALLAAVGMSGQGKTTVAAAFCAAGALLFADDLLPISAGPGSVDIMAVKTAVQLRLRPKAQSLQETFPKRFRRPDTVDGRRPVAPKVSTHTNLPVGVIILPVPDRDADACRARPLRPPEAAARIAACQRIEGWHDPERMSAQFSTVLDIVGRVPVLEVRIPWGPPFAPDLAHRIGAACKGVDSRLASFGTPEGGDNSMSAFLKADT